MTLLKEENGICCVITVEDKEGSLRCQLGSLCSVVNGMRYHFAGDNVLCTLSLADSMVAVDVQLGNGSSISALVPVDEYRSALLRLEQTATP